MSQTEKFRATNANEVSKWLHSQGWEISGTSIRKHVKIGKLHKVNGYYNEDDILNYAIEWLKRADTGSKLSCAGLASLKKEKLRADIDAARARAAKAKFELAVDKGAYIPRGGFERELAARAEVLGHGIRHLIESSTTEIIELCNGDVTKTQDIAGWFLERLETCLHEYATPKQWHVIETRPARENIDEADYKRFKVVEDKG